MNVDHKILDKLISVLLVVIISSLMLVVDIIRHQLIEGGWLAHNTQCIDQNYVTVEYNKNVVIQRNNNKLTNFLKQEA